MNDEAQKRPLVSYSFGVHTERHAPQTPPSEAPERPAFIWRGEQLDVEALPWRVWQAMREEFGALNGWTFTRFARHASIETREPVAALVFGIVSGGYGIFRDLYDLCGHGVRSGARADLSALVHLRSGAIIGLFIDDQDAMIAAVVGGFMARDEEPAYAKLVPEWQTAGLRLLAIHAHDIHDEGDERMALDIWAMPAAEGKPS